MLDSAAELSKQEIAEKDHVPWLELLRGLVGDVLPDIDAERTRHLVF